MRVRVVAYAPDHLTDTVASRVAGRFSLDRVDLLCPAYRGWVGALRAWRDRHGAGLPDIAVSRPIGSVDAVIIGAPLVAGRLAAPMQRFIEAPHRIPPVIGVFATCQTRRFAPGFDDDLAALDNGLGGPENVTISLDDISAARDRDPPALTAFLDRLDPLVRMPLTPVLIPDRVA